MSLCRGDWWWARRVRYAVLLGFAFCRLGCILPLSVERTRLLYIIELFVFSYIFGDVL